MRVCKSSSACASTRTSRESTITKNASASASTHEYFVNLKFVNASTVLETRIYPFASTVLADLHLPSASTVCNNFNKCESLALTDKVLSYIKNHAHMLLIYSTITFC